MAIGLPVSVTAPSWMSPQMGSLALGGAGGLLFGDFVAAAVIGRTAWTGATAFLGSSLVKAAISITGFWGASKVTGMPQIALFSASAMTVVSIVADAVRTYLLPQLYTAEARLAASFRGRRVAPVAAPVRLEYRRATVPTAVRTETPSGEALGGF